MTVVNEKIKFRLFHMPCCGQLLCWVNPRIPNYCPECGKMVYTQLKFEPEHTKRLDEDAWIKFDHKGVI